jgi:HSP20 family molecular chaperone IbpA
LNLELAQRLSPIAISAKTDAQTERKDGEKLLYTERCSESFARSFELPQAIDTRQGALEAAFRSQVPKRHRRGKAVAGVRRHTP